MFRSNRYLPLVLGTLAAFGMGCGDSPSDSDGGADGGGSGGSEYVYVMDTLGIDTNEDPMNGPVSGYDLDNLKSVADNMDACGFADFTSLYDMDQGAGVDNQLPALANALVMVNAAFDVRTNIQNAVNRSNLVLLARISNVNDLNNDDNVTVRIYVGHPTFTDGCTSVTAGREYVVDSASVNNNNLDDSKFQFQGRIVNGRLQASGSESGVLQLALPLGGRILPINLYGAQLRMNLTADRGTNGNLGGAVRGQDMVDAVCAFNTELCTPAAALVGGFVDIEVNDVCYDTSGAAPAYGNISLGMNVSAVRATIRSSNSVVEERPTGACGSAPITDGGT